MSYENKYLDLFIKHKEAVDAIIDQSVKIEKLEQQLKEANEVISETSSRAIYTYSNTACVSCKERVIKMAQLNTKYLTKYKVKEMRNE
jgi:hypothetical protein